LGQHYRRHYRNRRPDIDWQRMTAGSRAKAETTGRSERSVSPLAGGDKAVTSVAPDQKGFRRRPLVNSAAGPPRLNFERDLRGPGISRLIGGLDLVSPRCGNGGAGLRKPFGEPFDQISAIDRIVVVEGLAPDDFGFAENSG
jgi:hypothetical protein